MLSLSKDSWFPKHVVTVLERNKAFEYIEALLKLELPPGLMVEILKPYVYNMRAEKVSMKKFPSRLFPVPSHVQP